MSYMKPRRLLCRTCDQVVTVEKLDDTVDGTLAVARDHVLDEHPQTFAETVMLDLDAAALALEFA